MSEMKFYHLFFYKNKGDKQEIKKGSRSFENILGISTQDFKISLSIYSSLQISTLLVM